MRSTSRMLFESTPPLNTDGLPMRMGMKKCLHYMRYGKCKFGVDCVFHHPNPPYKPKRMPMTIDNHSASASASRGTQSHGLLPLPTNDPPYKPKPRPMTFDNNSASSSRGTQSHGLLPLPTKENSMPNPRSSGTWISYPQSFTNYQNDNSSFYNVVNAQNFLPKGSTVMHSQWFPFQAPSYMHGSGQSVMMPELNPIPKGCDKMMPVPNEGDKMMMPAQAQSQSTPMAEEHQFICVHMLKTVNCRFGSECRFQHSTNLASRRDEGALSDKGLPLRPEKAMCRHYGSFGLCKSGPACLFDHPEFAPVQQGCSNTKEGEGEGRSSSMTLTKETGVNGGGIKERSWLSICFPDYK